MSLYMCDHHNAAERLKYMAATRFTEHEDRNESVASRDARSTRRASKAVPIIFPKIGHTPGDKNENASRFGYSSNEAHDERPDEPNLKELLTKDPVQAKPEVEWYRVKDIKSNLVDINCQRIFKILTEGALDMDVSLLVPLLCRNLMELPAEVFGTMKNSLLRFQSLLEDYMKATGASMRRKTTDENTAAVKNARSIEGNIKRQLRIIFKTINAIPEEEEMQNVVNELQGHKPIAVQNFQREYDRFREAMRIRLSLKQRELVENANTVHQSLRRKPQQHLQIATLEDKLSKHGERTKDLCNQLDKKIEKVSLEACTVMKNSAAQVKTRNGLLNDVHEATATSEKRQAKLEEQKKHTRLTLNTLIDDHHKEETKLREKKYKMETEKDNWVMKYDKDMGSMQDQLDVLWVDYSAQRKILDALEEKFAVLEVTYNEIVETWRAEEEERTRAGRELLSMNSSSAIIQAFWRTRAVLKRLQSKGKKRKGKK